MIDRIYYRDEQGMIETQDARDRTKEIVLESNPHLEYADSEALKGWPDVAVEWYAIGGPDCGTMRAVGFPLPYIPVTKVGRFEVVFCPEEAIRRGAIPGVVGTEAAYYGIRTEDGRLQTGQFEDAEDAIDSAEAQQQCIDAGIGV